MGLFSSKTKISTASASMNLINDPPDRIREAALYALMSNTPLIEGVMATFTNGISRQAKQAYDYAYKSYTLGLPESNIQGLPQADDNEVKAAIESENPGTEVAIIFSFVGPLTAEAAVASYLRDVRGYKLGTELITIHPFTPTIPKAEIFLYSAEYIIETKQIKIAFRARYENDIKEATLYQEFIEYVDAPPNLQIHDVYCFAAYKIYDANTNTYSEQDYFWYYQLSTNTYPEITYQPVGFGNQAYMPIVPLRRNNVDLTAESKSDTELFITSKKLLKKMGLDFEYLGSRLNENPDISDIDHAYVMFGVDLLTDRQESMRYIFNYFEYLHDVSLYTKEDFKANWEAYVRASRNNSKYVQKSLYEQIPESILKEYGIDISVSYYYITSTVYAGTIGPVGHVTRQVSSGTLRVGSGWFANIDFSTITFNYQLNHKQYKSVTVYGPAHLNNIYEGYGEITMLSTLAIEPENLNFIIPIHFGIAKQLPMKERNMLYYNSCRLIINSVEITKVKWYQKGFFQALFFLGTLVIAAITQQPWLAGLSTAMAAGAMATLMYILPGLIIGIAMNFAAKFLTKELGAEAMMIVGAITAVLAISKVNFGTFNVLGKTIPTAEGFLMFSQASFTGVQDYINNKLEDIQEEAEQFSKEAEAKTDKLETAQELLKMDVKLNPFQMLNAFQPIQTHIETLIESPDDFYYRTIHAGNIGVLTLDVVENYVGIMLNLPKPQYV